MSHKLLQYILNKQHHRFRRECNVDFAGQFSAEGLSPIERMTRRFEALAKMETPVILPDEQICFVRTIKNIPDCFTQAEWAEIKKNHFIHEMGYMSNLSPDYEDAIAAGLLKKREEADDYGKRVIDAVINLADRYRQKALEEGRDDIAAVLNVVPRYGATNFREALQFFRILHYSLWLEGNYHNTVGRFDKYMYPYLKSDMEKGIYTEQTALELLEDFFISFNKDSDLYPGVQQGDNGQSMVLGGIDADGNQVFNLISKLSLEASKNLLLIDPKINLRVGKDTPIEVYELGSELTKAGLGFPQYSNDDVVIDGLVRLGYDIRDARDYAMAACWEFIIPKVGADVANIGALNLPKVVDTCLHNNLAACGSFDEFMSAVNSQIVQECDKMCSSIDNLWFVPSPFMNVLMDCDIYKGGKYNNFGFHGTGIATATDSLAVIKKYVFEDKSVTKDELLTAVDSNFEQNSHLLPIFRYQAPKMGNDVDWVDDIAVKVLDMFSSALEGRTNCRGGKYRAGTGSAMFYLWHADEIGASPDGRRKGEPYGTNFSASLFAKINGPISVIKSFSKPHFENAINGGPLTLEFHNSMFTDSDCISKVAMLVKSYISMGGHQLQLNAINPDRLRDAQLHPENHRQLVVRIWGWSAYFVELDREFQNHVLSRQAYKI
ncbi:MAG: pyruvate formate-lyase [Clostridia bacterium]|nr:pyruvate formate-lyase [Clostridia bacterium]